jgi:hypothetical protein
MPDEQRTTLDERWRYLRLVRERYLKASKPKLRLATARLTFRNGLRGSPTCLSRNSSRPPGRQPASAGFRESA